jgi:DNA invertase Pin-like site-specific DNA recombinase
MNCGKRPGSVPATPIGAQASAPRAAVYLRVSTGRQAEQDLSIPDQKAQTRAWAAQRGWTVVAEYVEPGASATDDKRPEFQKMIERACDGENAFDVIVVHSFSRFFRDAFGLEFYVRKLAKHGVRLVSITQELGDDPAQVMMRQVIALFDEYQSKENAKHVLRAMKENARQGFWNGSCPPLGYRTVEAERRGGAGQEETRRRSGRGGAGATHFQTVHRGPPGLRPDGNQDASCGGSMTLRAGTSRSGEVYRYYSCSSFLKKGRTACRGRSMRMDKLDLLVTQHMADRLLEPEQLTTLLSSLAGRRAEKAAAVDRRLAALAREAEEADERLRRLYQLVEDGRDPCR